MIKTITHILLVATALSGATGLAQQQKRDAVADGMRFLLEQVGKSSTSNSAVAADVYRNHFGLNEADFAVVVQEAKSLKTRDNLRNGEVESIQAGDSELSEGAWAARFRSIGTAREQDLLETGRTVLRAVSPEAATQLRQFFLRIEGPSRTN